jgi:hypothetical protein
MVPHFHLQNAVDFQKWRRGRGGKKEKEGKKKEAARMMVVFLFTTHRCFSMTPSKTKTQNEQFFSFLLEGPPVFGKIVFIIFERKNSISPLPTPFRFLRKNLV